MSLGLHIANHVSSPVVCRSANDSAWQVCNTGTMAKKKKKASNPPNHLRAWREFREMTQEQLAEKAGTTKGVISLIESGDRGLTHKWATRLAPYLGTRPGYLLDNAPEDLPTEFLDLWRDIPDEAKPQARQILETFRKRA